VRISPSLLLLLTALMLGGSGFIASAWSAVICRRRARLQNAAVRTIAGVTINTVFITRQPGPVGCGGGRRLPNRSGGRRSQC